MTLQKSRIGWSAGALAVTLGAGFSFAFDSSAEAAGPTIEFAESGMEVTAKFLGIPEGVPCALVAWDGALFDEVDLESSEKAASLDERALTTPSPQFIFTESIEPTLKMIFPSPGKFVVAAGCTSLEDGTDKSFLTKTVTVKEEGIGSIDTGSFGS